MIPEIVQRYFMIICMKRREKNFFGGKIFNACKTLRENLAQRDNQGIRRDS